MGIQLHQTTLIYFNYIVFFPLAPSELNTKITEIKVKNSKERNPCFSNTAMTFPILSEKYSFKNNEE